MRATKDYHLPPPLLTTAVVKPATNPILAVEKPATIPTSAVVKPATTNYSPTTTSSHPTQYTIEHFSDSPFFDDLHSSLPTCYNTNSTSETGILAEINDMDQEED